MPAKTIVKKVSSGAYYVFGINSAGTFIVRGADINNITGIIHINNIRCPKELINKKVRIKIEVLK